MKTLIFLLIFIPASIFAQNGDFKSGNVPMDDLKMQVYRPDTSAAAVILHRYAEYSFDRDLTPVFYRHERIKILKNSGFDYATITARYRYKNSIQTVGSIKAATYNLNADGTVETSKLEGKQIFDENIDGEYHRKKFTLPNVKAGSVIEFSYMVTALSDFYGPEFVFQADIPVRYCEMSAKVPYEVVYQYIVNDPHHLVHVANEGYSQNISSSEGYDNHPGMNTRWIAQNIPAFKEEPFTTNPEDYMIKLQFQLDHIQPQGSIARDVSPTWCEISSSFYSQFFTARQLNARGAVSALAISLVANETDPYKKMQLINDWVVKNIRVIEDSEDNIDLNDVLTRKAGDKYNVALLHTLMLTSVGLDAKVISTSSWENGKLETTYPFMYQLDYLLTRVRIDTTDYIVDATDKNRPPLLPPRNVVNRPALAIDKRDDLCEWVYIPARGKFRRMIRINADLDVQGNLKGTVAFLDDGYSALNIRNAYSPKAGKSELLKIYSLDKVPGLEVDSISIQNIDDIDHAVSTTIHFRMNQGNATGEHIYFNPFVIHDFSENPLKSESRDYPVDFGYMLQYNYTVHITLPEGFAVDELPKNQRMQMEDGSGEIKYLFQADEKAIDAVLSMSVNQSRYLPASYPALRQFFNLFVTKSNDQLVLKQK